MATILLGLNVLNEIAWISTNISLMFDHINNKSELAWAMAWWKRRDESWSGPMMIQFTNTYIHHQASMG